MPREAREISLLGTVSHIGIDESPEYKDLLKSISKEEVDLETKRLLDAGVLIATSSKRRIDSLGKKELASRTLLVSDKILTRKGEIRRNMRRNILWVRRVINIVRMSHKRSQKVKFLMLPC